MIAPLDKPLSGPRRISRTARVLADVPAFTAFAQEVEQALEGDELRYSQRIRLIKRAEHFGIRRFDANLIIAMVQGRHEWPAQRQRRRRSPVATLAAFAVIQSLILAAGWYILS